MGFINLDDKCYSPINGFTTVDLGCERGNNAYTMIQKSCTPFSDAYLSLFENLWNDPNKLQIVTDEVIDNITAAYNENAPDFIYFVTLYNIFNEFLDDISEDNLPNEATGFKDSKIWNLLFNYQKDAALAIINKLEKYNGCILADSVGLGKTFTALAVIKYYENRNKSVLVLCPKKLTNNWNTYIDKKGRSVDSSVKRGSDISDDISAYDLILKNKERLLSFDEPTRFIFSHSALREGWDNPNVFQICTLKHSDSQTLKRQEVGRGLRLCVDQSGNRMDNDSCGDNVHSVNMLTVIASDSYKDFVADPQADIKTVLYDRPSKATIEYFVGKTVMNGETSVVIDNMQAKAIYKYLLKNDYIDDEDNVTDEYRNDLANNSLVAVPEELKIIEAGIHKHVQGVFDESVLKDMVSDGHETKVKDNSLNDNFYKKEFQELWKAINHKYVYTVDFDSSELVKKAIDYINSNLYVSELQYTTTTGQQKTDINQYEIERNDSFDTAKTRTQTLRHAKVSQIRYDLIGKIAEGTVLTRNSVAAIIKGLRIDKFAMFKYNPEEFIAKMIRLIREQKATMIVDHISYNQIDGEYDSNIFTVDKSSQSFDKAFKAQKNVQDYVFTDGTAEKSVERRFAEDLDSAAEVCVYAKLPKGFNIPTPLGHYSPDWAIAFNEGTVKHIYFIAETKGSMSSIDLRPIEKAKIDCAKVLFKKMKTNDVQYEVVKDYKELLNIVSQ